MIESGDDLLPDGIKLLTEYFFLRTKYTTSTFTEHTGASTNMATGTRQNFRRI